MSAGPIAVAGHLLVYYRAFSNGNTVTTRTDVAIWRQIIMRKYLLFNERMKAVKNYIRLVSKC